jgi:large subunit ribosomal protein L36
MKIRSSLRSYASAPGAQVVRRGKKIVVVNKKSPRRTARQG